jgi:hypothetical protein
MGRDKDTNFIEQYHRQADDELSDQIGRRSYNSRDDQQKNNGMLAVKPHESRCEKPYFGENIGDEGEFENKSGGQQCAHKKAGIVLDRDIVFYQACSKAGKKLKRDWQKYKIAECYAGKKAEGDKKDGKPASFAFMFVQAGCDKLPYLPGEEWK